MTAALMMRTISCIPARSSRRRVVSLLARAPGPAWAGMAGAGWWTGRSPAGAPSRPRQTASAADFADKESPHSSVT